MSWSGPEQSWEICGGSVTGRAHRLAGRNNQDALGWASWPGGLAAVVSDGCSAGAHSEVGAQLAVRWAVRALARRAAAGPVGEAELAAVHEELLDQLGRLLATLGGGSLEALEVMRELLLFTLVGVVLGPEGGCAFALGDGLLVIDGVERPLAPAREQHPAYLAYGLWPAREGLLGGVDQAPGFTVFPLGPDEGRTVLLGTDGVHDLAARAGDRLPGRGERVGTLAQFWEDDRYYANRDAVRRRLALCNRDLPGEPGLLPDDTTLVAVRLRRGAEVRS